MIRQTLTAVLVLLFVSENVALASVFSETSGIASRSHAIVQHEVHTQLILLAEENEERDLKNACEDVLERGEHQPHPPSLITSSKIHDTRNSPPNVRSLPIYAYYCSFLI